MRLYVWIAPPHHKNNLYWRFNHYCCPISSDLSRWNSLTLIHSNSPYFSSAVPWEGCREDSSTDASLHQLIFLVRQRRLDSSGWAIHYFIHTYPSEVTLRASQKRHKHQRTYTHQKLFTPSSGLLTLISTVYFVLFWWCFCAILIFLNFFL